MLAIVLASMLQAVASPPPAAPTIVLRSPELPDDWEALPTLKLQRRWPESRALSSYVRDEVRAGRCASSGNQLRVDMAVLVARSGQLRRIRPRAIGCPTVEQYASGIMLSMARSNVAPPDEDRWFRAVVTFAWE